MPKYSIIPWPKAGDRIRADDGFTCLADGAVRTVLEDGDGLYVHCGEGRHYLDGQECHDDPTKIIGFFKA